MGGVDVEEGGSEEAGVVETLLSFSCGNDSTWISALSKADKELGFSLVIFDRNSVLVPLTAFETVFSVFLTRDIC